MSGQPNEIKLIGNGNYGCIFHPGINFNKASKNPNMQIVNKVQENYKEVQKEVQVGNIITKIPHYRNRFAPIIESCTANLSSISNNIIEKCDLGVTKQNSSKFISSTIPYVGKHNILSYLESILNKKINQAPNIKSGQVNKKNTSKTMLSFLKKMMEVHIYLLESLKILQANNILHFDLKYNNVIYDQQNDVPIIIDYGLAVIWSNMKSPMDYIDSFSFNSYETYPYWCIESVLLMYICQNILNKNETQFKKLELNIEIRDIANMKETLKKFINGDDKRENRHVGMSAEEIKRFETKATHYINLFVGKTWKDLWNSLKNTQTSWDNYSMAQIFYNILHKFGLLESDINKGFMKNYIDFLKKLIMNEPGKRITIIDSITNLKNLANKVKKEELLVTVNNIKQKVDQPNYVEVTRQKIAQFKLNDLRHEQLINAKK